VPQVGAAAVHAPAQMPIGCWSGPRGKVDWRSNGWRSSNAQYNPPGRFFVLPNPSDDHDDLSDIRNGGAAVDARAEGTRGFGNRAPCAARRVVTRRDHGNMSGIGTRSALVRKLHASSPDTGAVIALERHVRRMSGVWNTARKNGCRSTIVTRASSTGSCSSRPGIFARVARAAIEVHRDPLALLR
jgi:hypothetical protein